ncbi:hypothetical protein HPB52_024614 [Rhipicephalus sanguineus]|uniref:Uncharacterized protein n=1 Tax=Rhipicephalus sanguineus TaxID=34632 RepID=A0A9D4TE14_RHISA|nr:hypothetical protein HPB52_024614 [Rhipicephalus sanguineus]
MDSPPRFFATVVTLFLLVVLAFANGARADSARTRACFVPAAAAAGLLPDSVRSRLPARVPDRLPGKACGEAVARFSPSGLVNALFFRRQQQQQQQQPSYQAYKPAASVKPDLVAAASKPLLHSAHKIHFPGSFQTDKLDTESRDFRRPTRRHLRDLYELMAKGEQESSGHAMERKAGYTPSLRLRFGRRSDPAWNEARTWDGQRTA